MWFPFWKLYQSRLRLYEQVPLCLVSSNLFLPWLGLLPPHRWTSWWFPIRAVLCLSVFFSSTVSSGQIILPSILLHIYTPFTFCVCVKCRIYTIHHPECRGFHTLIRLIYIQHYSHSNCCCLQYMWIVRTAITEASLLACWLFTDVKANLVSQKISKGLD